MHRRDFLGVSAGASLAALSGRAWAVSADGAPKRLVVVLLRGAVDGLSVVVPHGDEAYYAARPTIAIAKPGAAEGALPLDGHFGLHPALSRLLPLWQDKQLAFVHAAGSRDPTRSHFDAQLFIENGTPGTYGTPDGWMNRLLAAMPGLSRDPTEAVAVGPTLPQILKGRMPVANLPLGPAAATPLAIDKALGADWRNTAIVVLSEFGRTVRENGDGGTDHGHGNVIWVLGGAVQGGRVYGEWPGLASDALYESRDLAVTTDFRAVLAPVVARHLRLPDRALATIFPGFSPPHSDLDRLIA